MAVQSFAAPERVSSTAAARAAKPSQPSLKFDWAATGLSFIFVSGLFVDGWAHTHGKVDQSFFTLWHAILYAGWMLTASFFSIHALIGRSRGLAWREALPPGYFLSLIGAIGFGSAGLGDMAWHIVFGIEKGVEALLSPTHLALAVSIGLVVSGPLRASWARREHGTRPTLAGLPAALSLALTITVITFFLSIGHPISQLWGARIGWHYNDNQEAAILGMLLNAALLTGAALLVAQRKAHLPGTLTLVFGLSASAMMVLNGDLYPRDQALGFMLAGAACDGLCLWLRPTPQRPAQWRLFGTLVPVILYACYFASIQLNFGIGWRIHAWLGIIVMSGLVGFLLSMVVPAQNLQREIPAN